jgi:hypothetical protein
LFDEHSKILNKRKFRTSLLLKIMIFIIKTMAKYYHKCSICNKTVKRKPNFKGKVICNSCKKNENTIKCLNCGKYFKKRVSKRKFCSRICSGKYLGKHVLKGRKLSITTKEKLSKIASSNNNGIIKTKYYKIYSPFMKKNIAVQGTYELKYAKYLNENNINWIRSKEISIQYKKSDNVTRNYFPDFYLPNINEYIEIKGYFFPKDKEKMKLVQEQNMNKKIRILFKKDLIKLRLL